MPFWPWSLLYCVCKCLSHRSQTAGASQQRKTLIIKAIAPSSTENMTSANSSNMCKAGVSKASRLPAQHKSTKKNRDITSNYTMKYTFSLNMHFCTLHCSETEWCFCIYTYSWHCKQPKSRVNRYVVHVYFFTKRRASLMLWLQHTNI